MSAADAYTHVADAMVRVAPCRQVSGCSCYAEWRVHTTFTGLVHGRTSMDLQSAAAFRARGVWACRADMTMGVARRVR